MKTFDIYKNGTIQGEVQAKNLKEAKKIVFATYGEDREVEEQEEEETEIFTITKKNFLQWYFNTGADSDQKDLRTNLGEQVIQSLFDSGKSKITIKSVFNENCEKSCIPLHYLEEFKENDGRELQDLTENWELTLID